MSLMAYWQFIVLTVHIIISTPIIGVGDRDLLHKQVAYIVCSCAYCLFPGCPAWIKLVQGWKGRPFHGNGKAIHVTLTLNKSEQPGNKAKFCHTRFKDLITLILHNYYPPHSGWIKIHINRHRSTFAYCSCHCMWTTRWKWAVYIRIYVYIGSSTAYKDNYNGFGIVPQDPKWLGRASVNVAHYTHPYLPLHNGAEAIQPATTLFEHPRWWLVSNPQLGDTIVIARSANDNQLLASLHKHHTTHSCLHTLSTPESSLSFYALQSPRIQHDPNSCPHSYCNSPITNVSISSIAS